MNSQYLISLDLLRSDIAEKDLKSFPFSLPAIKNLDSLHFHPNVTFFVGENGTGKSTLLEAIAIEYGFNPEGGSKNFSFSTQDTHSSLSQYLRLAKGVKKPRDGYFLRAESYYNVASHIDELDKIPGAGAPISSYYGGQSLHTQSHGESFFSLFFHRFYGNGLYILDEPEAALSPQRQLSFLRRLHDLVHRDSQFIIATHSPIILSYPHARIIHFGTDGLAESTLKDTDHYSIYRSFLNHPEKMLNEMGINSQKI